MKLIIFALLLSLAGLQSQAQVTKVSLQASGLTCSMCSKAVMNALQKVPFVDKVQVDIKNQQYNLSFKEGTDLDFDALSKAVQDAGFSVAAFTVTADVSKLTLEKDEHILIGKQYFHFLNASGQQLNGPSTFTVVDKQFTSSKNYKKYSALSKMECVQTGHTAKCCTKNNGETTRIYHAII
jgi:copper chaperone CopZ